MNVQIMPFTLHGITFRVLFNSINDCIARYRLCQLIEWHSLDSYMYIPRQRKTLNNYWFNVGPPPTA